jgi:hypothetical protein
VAQESNIYKKRKAWWLNPWIIGIAAVFILMAVPMELWIASYGSAGAVVMFGVVYICMLIFVIFLIKRSMLEPHLYVDEKELEKRRKEIQDHRQKVKSDFLRNELDALRRGERTPVLDIWRLNPQLLSRHPYFQNIDTVLLDPQKQELLLRLQIGELPTNELRSETFDKTLISSLISFLKIVAVDEYFQQLKQFFQTLTIELYTCREDLNRRKEPYPILSLLLRATAIPQLPYTPLGDVQHLKILGDVRYQHGDEITPHRGIECLRTGEL